MRKDQNTHVRKGSDLGVESALVYACAIIGEVEHFKGAFLRFQSVEQGSDDLRAEMRVAQIESMKVAPPVIRNVP